MKKIYDELVEQNICMSSFELLIIVLFMTIFAGTGGLIIGYYIGLGL